MKIWFLCSFQTVFCVWTPLKVFLNHNFDFQRIPLITVMICQWNENILAAISKTLAVDIIFFEWLPKDLILLNAESMHIMMISEVMNCYVQCESNNIESRSLLFFNAQVALRKRKIIIHFTFMENRQGIQWNEQVACASLCWIHLQSKKKSTETYLQESNVRYKQAFPSFEYTVRYEVPVFSLWTHYTKLNLIEMC